MTDAPKRIWSFDEAHHVETKPHNSFADEYHHADLSANLVRAALDAAAIEVQDTEAECSFFDDNHGKEICERIVDILQRKAADETFKAAIVASVMETDE